MDKIKAEFTEMSAVLTTFAVEENFIKINKSIDLMGNALHNGNRILSCGNGGSMCDAMHFAEELSGRFRKDRPALAGMALSDVGYLSCVANDYGWEYVFARGIEAFGQAGDVLLAISTSGNSLNVLRAAEAAKRIGMHVVGLTGKDGGKLARLCDVEIRVEHQGYADRIQEIHIKIIHSLIGGIERMLGIE